MEDQRETDRLLVKLPDGSRVSSVMIDEPPQPRHFYRVLSSDGVIIGEHQTLVELAHYLAEHKGETLEEVARTDWAASQPAPPSASG